MCLFLYHLSNCSLNPRNLEKAEEAFLQKDRMYDILLWVIVPIQYALLFLFLYSMQDANFDKATTWGKILSMGILCGSLGINVAHELGHRSTKHEQLMAKALLLTSLYQHFFIEHNRGHHKRVATAADPATSRLGESVFTFWIRSVSMGYVSAWRLEAKRLAKKHGASGANSPRYWLSWQNEMLRFQLIQAIFILDLGLIFNFTAVLAFVAAAVVGFLLLETVNYIEHYGLVRQLRSDGRYERVLPIHSWNSDHIWGRLLLFELSRHSDHHFEASRKYQVLRSFPDSPQMPTGYPGMILLALVPPLWFGVMHRKIKVLLSQNAKE
jgi:alkane 1-monooxygenase